MIGFASRGFLGGGAGGTVDPPTMTVISTFTGLNFATARLTPFQASLVDWPEGMTMAITVKYNERNEVLTARDHEGNWCWPFDVVENNIADTVSDPATLQLLPRGGWPPCDVEVQVAAVIMAQE